MENDYLWDKTGEDKEIEQLENALKSFRYQPTAPPVLPVKIFQPEEKPKFSFFPKAFRFAFAGFACLLMTFISLGIWFQFSGNKIEEIADLSTPIVQPAEVEIPDNSTPINPVAIDKKPFQPKHFTVQKPTNIVFRQNQRKVKANKAVLLTAEEKYAYDQLMLALSITGSKLREVKNKVNSVENSTATIQTLR